MRLKMTTAEDPTNYRYSGVLAHPTSFPSPYGIGDFGKGAYDFIDFLAESGQHLWQILPMVPITSFGNSPYQGYSVFAGEPLLISPELLLKAGLLDQGDLQNIPNFDPGRVDYDRVREYKYPLYKKAFECFEKSEDSDLQKNYDEFCQKNEDWLADYCLYMALKEEQDNLPWTKWPEALRNLDKQNRAFWEEKLKMGIHYQAFLQFMFDTQWYALKKYAHDKGIAIVGDIPIFVSPDGADVWANRKLFQVDTKGYPSAVAGVPPDYFSATGQKWGNPLYDWKEHKKEGYRWWIDRVKHQLDQVDYVRIDHFRGFEAYWEVPVDAETAMTGEWKKGPGADLFLAIQKELGDDLPIFAEDLGLITPEVVALRDQFNFTVGWYQHTSEYARDKVRRYMNTDASSVSWDFIRICLGTVARYAIFPVQDLLKVGSDCRMNTPGTAEHNWEWRFREGELNSGMAGGLRQMTELFGR